MTLTPNQQRKLNAMKRGAILTGKVPTIRLSETTGAAIRNTAEKGAKNLEADRLGQALIKYIDDNNVEAALEIISGGVANLNLKDTTDTPHPNFGNTPLIYAIIFNNVPVRDALLNNRTVDVNLSDHAGYTPLMTACIHRHDDDVKALLAHPDINVNIKNTDGKTALSYCKNMPKVCAELMKMTALSYCKGMPEEYAKLIRIDATAGGGKRSRTQRKRKCRLVVEKRETCCIRPRKGTKRRISRKMKRNCCK